MTTEEKHLITCLVEGLLESRFYTKHEMANALGVDVAALDDGCSFEVLDLLLHYCAENTLDMEPFLNKLTHR